MVFNYRTSSILPAVIHIKLKSMKTLKIFLSTGLIFLSILFIQACSKSDYNNNYNGGGGGGGVTAYDTVNIQAMSFSPADKTVVLGTRVTWKNVDTELHTVTSDDGTSFNSGNISTNGVYSYTFNSYGSFPYHCNLHSGMTGTIQVVTR
jgi:plastocyanin